MSHNLLFYSLAGLGTAVITALLSGFIVLIHTGFNNTNIEYSRNPAYMKKMRIGWWILEGVAYLTTVTASLYFMGVPIPFLSSSTPPAPIPTPSPSALTSMAGGLSITHTSLLTSLTGGGSATSAVVPVLIVGAVVLLAAAALAKFFIDRDNDLEVTPSQKFVKFVLRLLALLSFIPSLVFNAYNFALSLNLTSNSVLTGFVMLAIIIPFFLILMGGWHHQLNKIIQDPHVSVGFKQLRTLLWLGEGLIYFTSVVTSLYFLGVPIPFLTSSLSPAAAPSVSSLTSMTGGLSTAHNSLLTSAAGGASATSAVVPVLIVGAVALLTAVLTIPVIRRYWSSKEAAHQSTVEISSTNPTASAGLNMSTTADTHLGPQQLLSAADNMSAQTISGGNSQAASRDQLPPLRFLSDAPSTAPQDSPPTSVNSSTSDLSASSDSPIHASSEQTVTKNA